MCSILDLKGFFLKIKNDIVIHVVVVVIIIVMIIIICISDSVFNLFSVIHNTVKKFFSVEKQEYLSFKSFIKFLNTVMDGLMKVN